MSAAGPWAPRLLPHGDVTPSHSTGTGAAHAFEEHTGEVRVRIEAPALPELFDEAGRTLAELMGSASPGPDDPTELVTVEANDLDALLVAWLDELIFRAETSGRIYNDVRVREIGPRGLTAEIRGGRPFETRTAVKAATLHGLRISTGPSGYMARVVLDV